MWESDIYYFLHPEIWKYKKWEKKGKKNKKQASWFEDYCWNQI